MVLYWPQSTGEWLSWSSAMVTILFGLAMFLTPRLSLNALRLQTSPKHPEAVAEARSTIAGFYLGVGVSAVLMAQFFLWFALGVCWAIAAFGRIISILSDGGNTPFNWIAFLVDVLLAAGPLLYVFGFIA